MLERTRSTQLPLVRRLGSWVALKARYWSRRLTGPHVISYDGVRLPIDSIQYSSTVVEELYRERYEEDEAAIVGVALEPGETVLELGAGIGFISTLCAKLNANVYCIEANPQLISIAKRTFELNRVMPSLRHAAVGRSNGSVELFVSQEVWRSSTLPSAEMAAVRIEVPAIRLEDLLEEIRPSFLICDVEGAESGLFEDADLSCLRKVLVEVHPKLTGWNEVRSLVRHLFDSGFVLDTRLSRKNVLLFRREDDTQSSGQSLA